MKSTLTIIMSVFLMASLAGFGTTTAEAEGVKLKWERVEGVIVPGNALGGVNVVTGINSVGFSSTAIRGKARVNLETAQIIFNVEGLVLASTV